MIQLCSAGKQVRGNAMNESAKKIGKIAWDYANTNLGSTVIAAAASSVVTWILTKGSAEEELAFVKNRLDKSREEALALEKALQESNSRTNHLLMSQHLAANKLIHCKIQKEFCWSAYNNSFCFYKPTLYTEDTTDVSIGPNLKK